MTGVLANVLWPLAAACIAVSVVCGWMTRRHEWRFLAVAGVALLAVVCALQGAWYGAGWNAGLALLMLGQDWWNRRGRKVARELGAKSRAVLAAAVEKAREAGSRSPVPEGARA